MACFSTGIAGTPDQSFYVSTSYYNGDEWKEVSINNYETTGFLTPDLCLDILNRNNPRILHYDVDLGRFKQKAIAINYTLHNNGVAARDRARVVAGLLLALANDSTMRIVKEPMTLVNDVNGRIEAMLVQHGKESFKSEMLLKLPSTAENHRKYWSAIVLTMQHLREMNIRSAINSGTDALGQFYETFIKYANDANEMGIVLTPRHITRFAAKVMDIKDTDMIFDPACGTGGFLVAALDEIRLRYHTSNPDLFNIFRNDCLFGVEESEGVFGMALVNMIFRGDGKSHIHNGNCFDNNFVFKNGEVNRIRATIKPSSDLEGPFSRVLMNPPFAQNVKERQFVDYALNQMCLGGLLFAILPNNPITGHKEDKLWRRELLKRHTLRSVVKMPNDLFDPMASKGTYALILEAWKPHQSNDQVFFGILHDDISASYKSKTLNTGQAQDNLEQITNDLSRFLLDQEALIDPIPQQVFISKLNLGENLDFAPESYLKNNLAEPKPNVAVEGLYMTLMQKHFRVSPKSFVPYKTREYELEELFKITRGKCSALKNLTSGEIPVVTTSEKLNGIGGYYKVEEALLISHAITISANGSGGCAFWHPYVFTATNDVLVCSWKPEYHDTDDIFALYVCQEINANAWRYDYYRKCSLGRLLADVRVTLPMVGNEVDFDWIQKKMISLPGFKKLSEALIEKGQIDNELILDN